MWCNRISTLCLAGVLALGLTPSVFAERSSEAAAAVQEDAAAPAAVQDPEQDAAARRCKIRVSSAQSSSRRKFSATEILDLDFTVKLARVTGEHLLRVDLSTPKGHPYQSLTVPFSTEASAAGALRSVAGFPRPLEVRATETTMYEGQAVPSVVVQLPVAGTPIVHSALYGKWTATAYLDDETEACGRSRRFRIRP